MIDSLDISDSTLRLLAWQALEGASTTLLVGYARDSDSIVRTLAAKRLQLIGTSDVFNAAIDFCSDSNADVREVGCFILGQLGTPLLPFAKDSVDVLVRALGDSSEDVREASLAAMGHLGHESFRSHLIAAASSSSPKLRSAVAFALGRYRGPDVVRLLTQLASDSEDEVRDWATIGLELQQDT